MSVIMPILMVSPETWAWAGQTRAQAAAAMAMALTFHCLSVFEVRFFFTKA
jgi:hypothetical protein